MICVTTGDTNRFIAEFLPQAGKGRGMGGSRRGTVRIFHGIRQAMTDNLDLPPWHWHDILKA